MRPKTCRCRKFSSQGAFPTTFWKNLDSRVANILEPPQNASENALMSQIRFPTIELGYSPLQCKDIFFFACAQKNLSSQGVDISLPPQNTTKKRPSVANLVLNKRNVTFSTTTSRNIFFPCAQKILAIGHPTFQNRPRTRLKTCRCRNLISQPSN